MRVVLSLIMEMLGRRTVGKLTIKRGDGSKLEGELAWEGGLIRFSFSPSQLKKALEVFE